MALQDILARIDALKREADALRPIPADRLNKLNQKLRLYWNYNSNAIEGNTLTLSETRVLLTTGIHTGDKLGKHYKEMEQHNEVLLTLEELVNKREPISEKLIRELHHQMMGDDYTVSALDSLNNPVNVKGKPGEYKDRINGANRLVNGREVFTPYKTPDEVRIEMPELVEWYRQEEEKKELHPVRLAALLHYKFVTLHPFDDGNGRLARILMNMALMRNGFTPAIIKKEERDSYINSLAIAQSGGSREPFIELVAKDCEWSLDLLIRAAKGENIDEIDDIDKEIELLKREIDSNKTVISLKKSPEIIADTFNHTVIPILQYLEKHCQSLQSLFFDYNRIITYGPAINIPTNYAQLGNKNTSWDEMKNWAKLNFVETNRDLNYVDYEYYLLGFRHSIHASNYSLQIKFNFRTYNYSIVPFNNNHQEIVFGYGTIINNDQLMSIVNPIIRSTMETIKEMKKNS
jgi:Fic family protein